ncbi:MAG TPA: methionine gamma-lyase family protein [Candidatus Coprocola pullicola]|nr:methionine gamma-lyase family protein [Candidatus Coprocola pullicola]
MQELYDMMQTKFGISQKVLTYCLQKEEQIKEQFQKADEITEYNQLKVLSAMQKNKLSDIHFAATTGYGYNDLGRDVLENIYADVFCAQSALVRPQLISGTHALTVALAGNLRPGDEILSPVGIPYDTLQGVIGIRKEKGSLREYGITYRQVDLLPEDKFDFDSIEKAITKKTKLVTIQRSKGYQWRTSFSIAQIKELIEFIKSIKQDIICMVDNCYGEFVEMKEPIEVGADLAVGSLIKNPGGGLAPIGGYIVGKEEFVENAAYRLTAPGLGKEVGATLGITSSLIQGLFMAPQVVNASIKTAIFTSKLFEGIGFSVLPKSNETRADIVQLIQMESAENVIAFCQGIQKGAPVDSYVTPEPWDMPGYDCPVIMAAGAFVQGSSIELSADAPIKPPYSVYMQGGLSWHHGKIGVMIGLQTMVEKGLIQL